MRRGNKMQEMGRDASDSWSVGTMPAYPVPRASAHYITCDVTSKLSQALHNAMRRWQNHRMARGDAKACREAFCVADQLMVQRVVGSGGKVKHTPSTAVQSLFDARPARDPLYARSRSG